jgi:hypothetical protein
MYLRNTIRTLCLAALLAGSASGAYAQEGATVKDRYHVRWTDHKGLEQCRDMGSQVKAERFAEKLQGRAATGVQVMAGRCNRK